MANIRSGLLTLHSLVPERFFKALKGLPLNGGNCGQVCPQTVRRFAFQAFYAFTKIAGNPIVARQSGRKKNTSVFQSLTVVTGGNSGAGCRRVCRPTVAQRHLMCRFEKMHPLLWTRVN